MLRMRMQMRTVEEQAHELAQKQIADTVRARADEVCVRPLLREGARVQPQDAHLCCHV